MVKSDNVIYTGPDLTCTAIATKDNLTDIIKKLDKAICSIPSSTITLTTLGTSGPSTLIDNVLNIPIYSEESVIGTGTTNYITKWISPNSIGDSGIYEDSIGNIGISTNAPIAGGGGVKWITLNGNSAFSAGIIYNKPGVGNLTAYIDNDNYFSYQANPGIGQKFFTNGSEKLRIATITGNLLLNTTIDNGADKLQVNGTAKFFGIRPIKLDSTTGTVNIIAPDGGWAMGTFVRNTTDTAAIGGFGVMGNYHIPQYHYIGADYQNPLAAFFTNGNVGIGFGTTNQSDKFAVNGSGLFTGGLKYTRGVLSGSTDLNTVIVAGFYTVYGGAPNTPGTGDFYLTVENGYGDSNYVHQVATSLGNGIAQNIVFTRTKLGGTWTPWKQLSSTAVSGAGTPNYIPRWDANGDLVNSAIYQDANGNIGINNATPKDYGAAWSVLTIGGTTKIGVLKLNRPSFSDGPEIYQDSSGNVFFNWNSGNVGFTMNTLGVSLKGGAATHPLTLPSTAAANGIALYTTVDQGTNYERLRIFTTGSNLFNITSEAGGTGILRTININGVKIDSKGSVVIRPIAPTPGGGIINLSGGTSQLNYGVWKNYTNTADIAYFGSMNGSVDLGGAEMILV
jgi:hypothetical protein